MQGAGLSTVVDEAERRHRQILQQVVEQYEQHCTNAVSKTIEEAKHAMDYQVQNLSNEVVRQRSSENYIAVRDKKWSNWNTSWLKRMGSVSA